jgi:Na+/melibiose symporter-like transporter
MSIQQPAFRWRQAFFLGLVTYSASAAAPVFDTFVPVLLQAGHPLWTNQSGLSANVSGFGLAPSLAFFIMTWDNLFNLFIHPWVGACSDRTWNRWGRRKPWIMMGVPIAALGLVLMPVVNSVAMMAGAIIIFNIGRALFVPPVIAWLGDLYPATQRSQANSAFSLVSGLAAVIVLLVSGALFEHVGRSAPFWFTAMVLVGLITPGLLWVREPTPVPPEIASTPDIWTIFRTILASGQRQWILILLVLFCSGLGVSVADTGASSFAVFELGMPLGKASAIRVISVISFILCALPSGMLATRIGRKRTVSLGFLVVMITYGFTYLFVTTATMYAAALFLAGVGGALVLVNILPLLFDVGDERFIGAFTGLAGMPAQLAAVVGPSIAGVIVERVGSQRVLFLVAFVALAGAWLLLARVKAPVDAKIS